MVAGVSRGVTHAIGPTSGWTDSAPLTALWADGQMQGFSHPTLSLPPAGVTADFALNIRKCQRFSSSTGSSSGSSGGSSSSSGGINPATYVLADIRREHPEIFRYCQLCDGRQQEREGRRAGGGGQQACDIDGVCSCLWCCFAIMILTAAQMLLCV